MNHKSDNSTGQPMAPDGVLFEGAEAADRRRGGLRDFLKARNLRVSDLARTLGLSTANAFYNFFNGHSDALSLPLIEMLLDCYPDTTFDELMGRPSRQALLLPARRVTARPRSIIVRSEARMGVWRNTVELSPERQVVLPLPHPIKRLGAKAFGVAVGLPGAERAYPAGSLLLARVYDGRQGPPADRTRVVVHRRRGPKIEVTIREVVTRDGELWLEGCSTCVEHHAPLQPSLPLARGRAAGGTDVVDVIGVVVWAWVSQTGTTII